MTLVDMPVNIGANQVKLEEIIEGWDALLDVREITKVTLKTTFVTFEGAVPLAEMCVSSWYERGCRPGVKSCKGLLEVNGPLGIAQIGSSPLGCASTRPKGFLPYIIRAKKLDRTQRKEMFGFSKPKKAAQIVFDIPHRMRFLPLSTQIPLNECIQLRQRTVVMVKSALCWMGTFQRTSQHMDGRFNVFLRMWREGGDKVVIQVGKGHGNASSPDFFSVQ